MLSALPIHPDRTPTPAAVLPQGVVLPPRRPWRQPCAGGAAGGVFAAGRAAAGSVLMADSDVRLRVEALRHAWMAERQGRVERAIERLDKIIDMAMELQRPDRRPEGDGVAAQAEPASSATPAPASTPTVPTTTCPKRFSTRGRTKTPISTRIPTRRPSRPPPKPRMHSRTRRPGGAAEPPEPARPPRPARRKRTIVYICGLYPPSHPSVFFPGSHRKPPRRRRFASLSCIPSPIASPRPASPGPDVAG